MGGNKIRREGKEEDHKVTLSILRQPLGMCSVSVCTSPSPQQMFKSACAHVAAHHDTSGRQKHQPANKNRRRHRHCVPLAAIKSHG